MHHVLYRESLPLFVPEDDVKSCDVCWVVCAAYHRSANLFLLVVFFYGFMAEIHSVICHVSTVRTLMLTQTILGVFAV